MNSNLHGIDSSNFIVENLSNGLVKGKNDLIN